MEFTVENLRDLHYVVVEAELRKPPRTKVSGLFMGYRNLTNTNMAIISVEDNFMFLSRGDRIRILSDDFYNISKIEIGAKSGAYVTQYYEGTQTTGLDRLKVILEALEKDKRTLPSGLVDVDKYVKIPKEYENDEDNFKSSSSGTTPSKNESSAPYRSTNAGYTYKPKKVSTTSFKRTTKYPIGPAIERMAAKIKEIKEGTYELPKLAEIPADKLAEKKAVTNKTTPDTYDDEDTYPNSGFYGLM